MTTHKPCPECGSNDLIPSVPISPATAAGGGNLTVQVGGKFGVLNAVVCGECGLVRLFAHNPQELLTTYRKRKG